MGAGADPETAHNLDALAGIVGQAMEGKAAKGTASASAIARKPRPGRVRPGFEKQFREWFGGSKVTDETGQPKTTYHSTDNNFTKFERGELGFHFGTAEQANKRGGTSVLPVHLKIENPIRVKSDPGYWGRVSALDALVESGAITKGESAKLLRKMDTTDQESIAKGHHGRGAFEARWRVVRQFLEAKGYDGTVYPNAYEGKGDSYIAFRPEQIKSATGNRGTYSRESADIRE